MLPELPDQGYSCLHLYNMLCVDRSQDTHTVILMILVIYINFQLTDLNLFQEEDIPPVSTVEKTPLWLAGGHAPHQ